MVNIESLQQENQRLKKALQKERRKKKRWKRKYRQLTIDMGQRDSHIKDLFDHITETLNRLSEDQKNNFIGQNKKIML